MRLIHNKEKDVGKHEREHYLDEEKQWELGALIAFVLLWAFGKKRTYEIGERLFLNHEHSRACE